MVHGRNICEYADQAWKMYFSGTSNKPEKFIRGIFSDKNSDGQGPTQYSGLDETVAIEN